MKDMEAEIKKLLKLIGEDGRLFSVLYDCDLLPEQLKEGSKEWSQMIAIAYARQEAIKREAELEAALLCAKEALEAVFYPYRNKTHFSVNNKYFKVRHALSLIRETLSRELSDSQKKEKV